MSSARDEFLDRVRRSVAQGNRAGAAAPRPDRGAVGYQGAGADPVIRFAHECSAAGGQVHVVANRALAAETVTRLVMARDARRVLLGTGSLLASLALAETLRAAGIEVVPVAELEGTTSRATFFQADIGVSGVDYLVAETGSVVLAARSDQPRSLSLLPPVHIAVAERQQLLSDLFDLFEQGRVGVDRPPSGLTIITGPSKTGDIELRLVTGVHGPGEVHVVLIDAPLPG